MAHVMGDIESLATTADAVIMSIGAVKFNLETGEIDDDGFYTSISIDSNFERGPRRISEDTLIWWMKQSQQAQGVFTEEKVTLREALVGLSDWLSTNDHFMWSNGADFDVPMLAHAYTQFGMEVPWQFWNARCFRTWKNLPGAKNVPLPSRVGAHNALADALYQARCASEIHKGLFGKPVGAKAGKAVKA